jgi:carboxyl-terminal processing protease
MLIAQNKGAGANIGGPDVCLVPPGIPVPFINFAFNAMAVAFCPNILLSFIPALNKGSKIPITTGDDPGTLGPGPKRVGEFVMGAYKIFLNGLQAINITSPTTGNSKNDGMGQATIPSATNVFWLYANGMEHGRISREAVAKIERSLRPAGVDSALLPGGVGLVTVRRFAADVPSAVYHAVRQLAAAGMESLVLDLRGNPGGEMNAFLQLAGDFLEPGSVLVTMTDPDGDETVYKARQPHPYAFPVAVLVDHGTASAAELFAGCLKAHGRAVVVGERTYGKGEAQAVVASPEGAVYGTVASFTLPDGLRVHGAGVEPDLRWPSGDLEAWSAEADGRLPPALIGAIALTPQPPSPEGGPRALVPRALVPSSEEGGSEGFSF